MNLPVEQFPILSSGQMSPFHQAIQEGLQNYNNILKSAYYPLEQNADIASKTAYANYMPAQINSSILSNPIAVASILSQPNGKQLISQMVQRSQQGGTTQQFLPGQNSDGSPAQPLWSSFSKMLPGSDNQPDNSGQYSGGYTGGGSAQYSQPAIPNQPSGIDPNNLATGATTDSPGQVHQLANSVSSMPGMQPPQAQPQMPQQPQQQTSGIGAPSLMDAAIAKQFPYSAQGMQLAAQAAAAKKQAEINANVTTNVLTEQGKKAADSMQDYMNDSAANVNNATTLASNTLDFDKAYKASALTGLLSNIPGVSRLNPEANIAARTATTAAVQMANQLFGQGNQKLTNYKEQLAQTTKFQTNMPQASEKEATDNTLAMTSRMMEQSNFNQYALAHGITDVNRIKDLWTSYNRDRPMWNSNDRSIITSNIKSYPQYIDNNLKGIEDKNMSVDQQIDQQQKRNSSRSNDDIVKMYDPDGVEYDVHKSNIAYATKKYKLRATP